MPEWFAKRDEDSRKDIENFVVQIRNETNLIQIIQNKYGYTSTEIHLLIT